MVSLKILCTISISMKAINTTKEVNKIYSKITLIEILGILSLSVHSRKTATAIPKISVQNITRFEGRKDDLLFIK